MTPLDHLVLAVPDLATGEAWFAELTGVVPVPGGSHIGLGTANALVGLTGAGAGGYLEIVGPDPAQPDPDRPRPLRVDEVVTPRLVTWAVRPGDLDTTVAAAREVGHDPGDADSMSRRGSDGELLTWRLTPFTFPAFDGVVPFLIDWGDTPHPTTRDLPSLELLELSLSHPDPPAVEAALRALDLDSSVTAGPAGVRAVLRTPKGEVVL